jgi:ATPase subunit of ABC transporter with duplicated ATPase domains
MHNHISVVDLACRLPDGGRVFASLTFAFDMVRTGLVGPNGIGKTTLLDVLAGRRAPSGGRVTRAGRIAYLPQTAGFGREASVAEVLGLAAELAAYERIARGEGSADDLACLDDRWDLSERVARALERLGVGDLVPSRRLATLSDGEVTRVRLAGLLLHEPDFLLLDEPTNHLDRAARAFVHDLVGGWRKGLIVVSHDRRLLARVDRIVEMGPAGLREYGGDFEFYREQRRIERAAAAQALVGAEQRLEQARAAAQRTRERQERRQAAAGRKTFKRSLPPIVAGNWKRHAENTAARLKGRHEDKVEQLQQEVEAARRNLPEEHQITIDLEHSRVPAQKRIVELEAVNYQYPGAAGPLWPAPLSLDVIGPERISLAGPNGSGKSTLIDLIAGRKMPTAGRVRVGASRVALLDQKVGVLDAEATVLDNLRRMAPRRLEHELRILLGRFLFHHDAALKPAAVLSGGERLRAGLACLLGADQAPELLIADEPTNNLDLASLEELTSALRAFRGTLIVVSHDATFLDDIGIEREITLDRRELE